MDNKEIKWTTKQIKKMMDYIAEHTPLTDEDFAELVKMAEGITKAAKGNDQVSKAVTSFLGAVDWMYQ